MRPLDFHTRTSLLLAAVVLSIAAGPASASSRPPIEQQQLAFWPERVASAREWSRFMHGTAAFEPRLIVEHWTASATQDAAIDYWNTGPEATWVHFIIDPEGRITQLAPLDALAKHAFGVSPWAIGIEHVGETDAEVMANPRMRRASYRLTCWLRSRLGIPLRGVIGHGEVTSHPRFRLTPAGWEWIESSGYQFHTDFSHRAMVGYREHLRESCDPTRDNRPPGPDSSAG